MLSSWNHRMKESMASGFLEGKQSSRKESFLASYLEDIPARMNECQNDGMTEGQTTIFPVSQHERNTAVTLAGRLAFQQA
jgi:hypothetical protein